MSKVLICFEGTHGDGKYLCQRMETNKFNDEVIRIYIAGCMHPEVGNDIYYPQLEIGAKNVSDAFDADGNLDLDKLKKNFGTALAAVCGKTQSGKIKVDEIILEGYSRGAFSACATAKHLDKHNIPMHIIADQPVPGTSKNLKMDYGDMSNVKNITSATTFFASMDARQDPHYFKQTVLKFPDKANAQIVLLPHQRHLDSLANSPLHSHMNKIFAEKTFSQPSADGRKIMDWYKKNPKCFFTPPVQMQGIYRGKGVDFPKDPVYVQMQREKARALIGKELNDVSDDEVLAVVALHESGFANYEFVLNNPTAAKAVLSFHDFSRSAGQIRGVESAANTFFHNMSQSIHDHSKSGQTTVDNGLKTEMANHAEKLNHELSEKASGINFTKKLGNQEKEKDSTKPFAEVFKIALEADIKQVCVAFNEANHVQNTGQESAITDRYKGMIREIKSENKPTTPESTDPFHP